MSKEALYRYNSDTDNFERVYPSFKRRVAKGLLFTGASLLTGFLFYILFYTFSGGVKEQSLRRENSDLRSQYRILSRRLENSMKIMTDIQKRDDNFYRVMMEMDPMGNSRGVGNDNPDSRYRNIRRMGDNSLVASLSKGIDCLDRQLYAQSISFDQLAKASRLQEDKIAHVPGVLPINVSDYTMSSGYGYRKDPVYGTTKFHAGLDFAANTGTPVFATGDGKVEKADRREGYGNCVDISHGYNYMTRYGHLSEITVQEGQQVKRGDMIGRVGSTGKSTGPHLHYEVRFKDEPQNPVNYYFMDLTPDQYAEMVREAENAGHVMD